MSLAITFTSPADVSSSFRAALGLATQRAVRDICLTLSRGLSDLMGDGGLIGVRSGTMRRNIKFSIEATEDGIEGTVYVDPDQVPYFAVNDLGGTIVPKTARALAIPLPAMLTGNGVARGSARDVRENPQAFGFTSTFIPKGKSVIFGKLPFGKKSGLPLAARKRDIGAAGGIVPLFVLKPSVTLPARHLTDTTLTNKAAYIEARLEQALQETVTVTFAQGGGGN